MIMSSEIGHFGPVMLELLLKRPPDCVVAAFEKTVIYLCSMDRFDRFFKVFVRVCFMIAAGFFALYILGALVYLLLLVLDVC